MSLCLIDGCRQQRGRYLPLCSHHRAVERTRGHPEQQPLWESQLTEYRKLIAKHVHGPNGERVLEVFKECWADFVIEGTDPLRQYEAGEPVAGHHREAAIELRGLADTADPAKMFETITALFLLLQFQPSFFKDHDAFAVSLQRFLRREAAGGYDLVWNATDQRYARKLRGLKARAAKTLGHWIIQAFAGSCGLLAVEIHREENRHNEQARQFQEALHELKYEWRTTNARRLPRRRKPAAPNAGTPHNNEAQ